jgi:hypothetical protein
MAPGSICDARVRATITLSGVLAMLLASSILVLHRPTPARASAPNGPTGEGLLWATRAGAAPRAPACGIVPSPNVGTSYNYLHSVSALAADDAWAVGQYWDDASLAYRTLAEHWDGQTWAVMPTPGPGFDDLLGVAAVGTDDVWAVGSSDADPLTEHWDGTVWNVVDSPTKGIASYLSGVAAVAPDDVWAVGFYKDEGDIQRTLAEHWDGSSWSVVSTPNRLLGYNYLADVAATAANDVWAVGTYADANGQYQPLFEHWNGIAWSTDTSPGVPDSANYLTGVTAISASDAWAVGYFLEGGGAPEKTLTMHWDGTHWSVVPSPNPSPMGDSLGSVAASSGANVWAVGGWTDTSGVSRPLIERWNGSQFRAKVIRHRTDVMWDVGIDPLGTVWTVGHRVDAPFPKTFTAVLC